MEYLRSNLHVIHIGTPVATQKHDKFIPEQALALSTKIAKNNFQLNFFKLLTSIYTPSFSLYIFQNYLTSKTALSSIKSFIGFC